MPAIDIRTLSNKIDKIHFADKSGLQNCKYSFQLELEQCPSFVMICAEDGTYVGVRKGDIPNLILALQKAVELGWDK